MSSQNHGEWWAVGLVVVAVVALSLTALTPASAGGSGSVASTVEPNLSASTGHPAPAAPVRPGASNLSIGPPVPSLTEKFVLFNNSTLGLNGSAQSGVYPSFVAYDPADGRIFVREVRC